MTEEEWKNWNNSAFEKRNSEDEEIFVIKKSDEPNTETEQEEQEFLEIKREEIDAVLQHHNVA